MSELHETRINWYNKNQNNVSPYSFKVILNNSPFSYEFPDPYKFTQLRRATVEISLETCGTIAKY